MIVGTIGELNENKNHIALIEWARQEPNISVAIVGEGELRLFLERKIQEYGLEERVKLFGFLPAKDVLRGFDIFALPSKKEGDPYALMEAYVAGLPIIIFDHEIATNFIGKVGIKRYRFVKLTPTSSEEVCFISNKQGGV